MLTSEECLTVGKQNKTETIYEMIKTKGTQEKRARTGCFIKEQDAWVVVVVVAEAHKRVTDLIYFKTPKIHFPSKTWHISLLFLKPMSES